MPNLAISRHIISFIKTKVIPFGAKVIGTILTPSFAAIVMSGVIAYVGWIYTDAIKDREIKVKFIEIATNILREPPKKDDTSLRTWAVQIINRYSEIKLSDAAKKDLIENIPIYGTIINLKIKVVDELGNPIEGADVDLFKEVNKVFTSLGHTRTDSKGETSLETQDSSGGKISITIKKEGYEIYSSDIQFIAPVTTIRAHLKKRH